GFSQTHVSGTGGGARYGNLLVQPTTGTVTPLEMYSPRADERASAGFYAVTLPRYGVCGQIAAARRSAIYEFHYPDGSQNNLSNNLIFDVSHILRSGERQGENQSLVSCEIHIVSPSAVTGSTTVKGGWNKQPVPYTVYFYGRTDTPAASFGTWT